MVRTLDETKRAAILQSARTILVRDGYAAAKMSDIAAAAGVAPGTLYLYFDSKEALASALGDDCLNRLASQFTKVIKKLDSPEGVKTLLDWALRIGVQERDIFALTKQSKPSDKSKPQAREVFVQQLAMTLENLMSQGIVRKYDDPTNLANVVLAIMHRIVMSCALYEDDDPSVVKDTAVIALEHVLFDDAALKRLRAKQ